MFSQLHTYTVHRKPDDTGLNDVRFVREGFNFFAFLFTMLWAFYYRLWLPGLILLAWQIAFMWLEKGQALHPISIALLHFAIQLVAGFCAQDWLRAKLKRQGYLIADIVTGDSRVRAEQRYFDRVFAV